MGKVIIVLWIAALAFGGFWFFYYQEGANRDLTIEFEGQGSMGGLASIQSGTLYVTKNKIAIVPEAKGGRPAESGRIILDMKEQKLFIVIDPQKAKMTLSFDLVDKSQCEPAESLLFAGADEMERRPDSKLIAGYKCHGFKAKGSGRSQTQGAMWFTYELSLGRAHVSLINKILRIKPKGDLGELLETSGEKRPQVSSFEYFPIPFAANVRSPQGAFKLEVKSVKRGKVDKSKFEVPSGYKEISVSEAARKLGGAR